MSCESARTMATMPLEVPRKRQLAYSIHKCSSSSGNYTPDHILEDRPSDQSSRWSSDTNMPPQFLVLKLTSGPAVVTSITFGKFEKTHVCNLKRFKIYAGCDEQSWMEVLDSGLKNDSTKETFRLRHTLNGHFFPCRFVKIVPVLSWGPSFNYSVWFVSLGGDDSRDTVQPAIAWHNEFREKEALRLCLKHFRQNNFSDVFECLQKRTRIQLEHPLLTDLHRLLVVNGDYRAAEDIVANAIKDGLFDPWIESQHPLPKWVPLIAPRDVDDDDVTVMADPGNTGSDQSSVAIVTEVSRKTVPGCRGGHQMVIDSASQILYLFGGWDGSRDLSDFWSFDIASSAWTQLSKATELDGGPGPRSCHKLVLDATCKSIFVLGRYVERNLRDAIGEIKSDFYMYDIRSKVWTLITDDTAAMGGPHLIFDHQMCIDQDTRTIFVFGGQTLYNDEPRISAEKRYSGLYEYHIPTNTWRKRRDDVEATSTSASTTASTTARTELRSRSSHSMLFHQGLRKLFILGGQRKRDDPSNDFFSYSVDTDEIEIIASGAAEADLPAVGHTQRATIDCERNEIHVMTGLNKDKDSSDKLSDGRANNSFWVYNIVSNTWSCFYKNENLSKEYWNEAQFREPRPRYAHQLVFDEVNRVHFLLGGNPGGKQGREDRVRLGDFWRLHLFRIAPAEVRRRCLLSLRTTNFVEMAIDNKLEATRFLQNNLSDVIDHDDKDEEKKFQLLASMLFRKPSKMRSFPSESESSSSAPAAPAAPSDEKHALRTKLFDRLSEYFPEEMTHPRGNLIDLIPLHKWH